MKKPLSASVSRRFVAISLVASAVVAGCASTGPSAAEVLATLKASFSERGPAKLDRLDQTDLQRACSEAASSGKPLEDKTRDALQKAIYDKLPYPADGKYVGDCR